MKYLVILKKSEGITLEDRNIFFIINISVFDESNKEYKIRIKRNLISNEVMYEPSTDLHKLEANVKNVVKFDEKKYIEFNEKLFIIINDLYKLIEYALSDMHNTFYIDLGMK